MLRMSGDTERWGATAGSTIAAGERLTVLALVEPQGVRASDGGARGV